MRHANASGIISFDGCSCVRIATTTITGSIAATAPFIPINAVNTPATSMIRTTRHVLLVPVRLISSCPAHAETPAISSPVAITSNAAMRMTTESPMPWTNSGAVRMPTKYSASEAPIATAAAGTRFHANIPMAMHRTASVMMICVVNASGPCDS